jgi:hypothetical protein
MVCWWVGMSVFAKLAWHDESFTLPMALLVNATLKLWIGIEAGQRLAEERRMGSLELLLSTPLNERQIMRGQFLALRRQFVKPLAAVLCLELLFLFAISRYAFVPSVEATRQVAIGLAGIALFILDTVALYWVALWTALAARVPTRAGAGAILRVLVVPWVLYALIAVIASLLTAASEGPSWQFFLGLWFVLGVLTDVGFGLSAWRRLHTRFREQAMRPLMAPRGKQV